MSEYTELGYDNRRAYLDSLAADYGIERETVYMMAQLLGRSEDFDGLVTALEDEADRRERDAAADTGEKMYALIQDQHGAILLVRELEPDAILDPALYAAAYADGLECSLSDGCPPDGCEDFSVRITDDPTGKSPRNFNSMNFSFNPDAL